MNKINIKFTIFIKKLLTFNRKYVSNDVRLLIECLKVLLFIGSIFMPAVSKREFSSYKKKHMKFHHEEEKRDERKDKKLIKVAIRKAKLRGKK
jgi:hypothetical protein